jgi:predicted Rossmann fold nucleotide-binding protein DprA/Smf involved in DNA uptake
MEEIYFGGIGSRETPENVLKIMTQLGYSLAKKDFILRSGGANGADLAFENGCDKANGKKEIIIKIYIIKK